MHAADDESVTEMTRLAWPSKYPSIEYMKPFPCANKPWNTDICSINLQLSISFHTEYLDDKLTHCSTNLCFSLVDVNGPPRCRQAPAEGMLIPWKYRAFLFPPTFITPPSSKCHYTAAASQSEYRSLHVSSANRRVYLSVYSRHIHDAADDNEAYPVKMRHWTTYSTLGVYAHKVKYSDWIV